LEGIDTQDLEGLLTELYQGVVEDRGNEFREINDTEMANNIAAVAEWMTGSRLTTSLLLQGTPGSGKTSLMNALYSLYRYYYGSSTYRCTAKMINDNYQSKLDKVTFLYDESRRQTTSSLTTWGQNRTSSKISEWTTPLYQNSCTKGMRSRGSRSFPRIFPMES
jgi:hypothetical protein